MKKDNLSKNKLKGKKIFDIVSWVVVSLLFISSLVLIITRKNSGSIDIFGSRYDVVLATSMSYKNEEHLDFLKGHNDQIQKMDVVRSKTVNKNTKLNVYDIVLFKDPHIGTNMHRIVDKRFYYQDEVYLQDVDIDENSNIVLKINNSAVYTNNDFAFKHAEITFVSDSKDFSDGYYFSSGGTVLDKTVKTTKSGNKYLHKVVINKDSDRPQKFAIVHSKDFVYTSEVIKNITLKSINGTISVNAKAFSLIEEGNDDYQYITNVQYEYEIRGDAAKTSDGWFTIKSIYSKVDKIIPQAGYFVRYITSIPGIIMLIGLGLLIVGVDYGLEYFSKKEKEKNLKTYYFLSNDDSCLYSLLGNEDNSEELSALKIGTDRYNSNIFKIEIDTSKYQAFKVSNREEEISLENVDSGTGFYFDEDGLHSYIHTQETRKGNKDESKKK